MSLPGGERRIDPADGNAYTMSDFVNQYGGYSQWNGAQPAPVPPSAGRGYYDQGPPPGAWGGKGGGYGAPAGKGPEEMRIDPSDGNAYTAAQFWAQYGGHGQWSAAVPVGKGGKGGGKKGGGKGGGKKGGGKGDAPPASKKNKSGGAVKKDFPPGSVPPPLPPGGEQRIDPADGNAYTKAEFVALYSGFSQWNKATRIFDASAAPRPLHESATRCDPSDGQRYTAAEFFAQYGGHSEWNSVRDSHQLVTPQGQVLGPAQNRGPDARERGGKKENERKRKRAEKEEALAAAPVTSAGRGAPAGSWD